MHPTTALAAAAPVPPASTPRADAGSRSTRTIGAGPQWAPSRLIARLRAAAERRRSLRALARLDPHLLDDIGLTRRGVRLALRDAGLTFPSTGGPQGAANW